MMGFNICFHEDTWKIIPKLSLLLLLIFSSDVVVYAPNEKWLEG